MGPLIDLLLQRPARFSEIHAALPERGGGLGPAMDALRVWAGAPADEEGRPIPHTGTEEEHAGLV